MATGKDRQEAAALARQILDEVDRGGIEADTPAARRLRRRLEGMVAAFEISTVQDRLADLVQES